MNKYIYKSTKNLFKYLQNWCAHSTRLTECVAISLRYCLFVSAKSVYCQRHALVLFVRSVELSQSAKKFVNDKLHVIKPVPQLQCKVLLLLFFSEKINCVLSQENIKRINDAITTANIRTRAKKEKNMFWNYIVQLFVALNKTMASVIH